jgi:hypothetical protein
MSATRENSRVVDTEDLKRCRAEPGMSPSWCGRVCWWRRRAPGWQFVSACPMPAIQACGQVGSPHTRCTPSVRLSLAAHTRLLSGMHQGDVHRHRPNRHARLRSGQAGAQIGRFNSMGTLHPIFAALSTPTRSVTAAVRMRVSTTSSCPRSLPLAPGANGRTATLT